MSEYVIRRFVLLALLLLCSAIVRGEDTPAPAPQTAPGAEQIAKWIKQLDDPDFDTRTNANQSLLDAGTAARPALEAALKSDSAEVRAAAGTLLERYQWEALPPALNYLDAMPADTIALLHTPSLQKLIEAYSNTAGAKLLEAEDFKLLRDWFDAYREKGGEKDILEKWASRFKGQFTAAFLDFNLLTQTPSWVVMAELPAEKTQLAYEECLKDLKLNTDTAEKCTAGLFIRSTKFKKSVAARVGRNIVFASDEPTLLKTANAFLKPIKAPLPASKEFAPLKPVLHPEQSAVLLFDLSGFLRRTLFFINLAAGGAQPEVKAQLDKLGKILNDNAWIGMTVTGKGERLEETYFYTSDKPLEGGGDQAAIKAALLKALSQAPANALGVIGRLPDDNKAAPDPKVRPDAASETEVTKRKVKEMLAQYHNLSKLLDSAVFDSIKGSTGTLSIAIPEGQALPVVEISDDPQQVKLLAEALSKGAEAAARDRLAMQNNPPAGKKDKWNGDTPPLDDVPPPPDDKNIAVEAVEKDGHTTYRELSESPLMQWPGRPEGSRLCWSARDSRLVVGAQVESIDQRYADLAAGKAGFDAAALVESDIDPQPLPFMAVIDLHRTLNVWVKPALPLLIDKAAGDAALQNGLRVLAKSEDLFKTLPPLSITAARPAQGAFEIKIRAPYPFFGIVAALGAISTATAKAETPLAPAQAPAEAPQPEPVKPEDGVPAPTGGGK